MSAMERVTVSIPAEVLAAAKAEAPDGNLSAYMAKAVRNQAVRDAAARLAAWRAGTGDDLDDLYDMQEGDAA